MSIQRWRKEKLFSYGINCFYYFSHKDNFKSILKHGILSKNGVEKLKINYKSIADEDVQSLRDAREFHLSDNKKYNLHDLVPVYLTPKTPTFYRHFKNNIQTELFFAIIESFIICFDEGISYAFSDGNSTSYQSKIHYNLNKLNEIDFDLLRASSWTDQGQEGVRKRNSEFLIHPSIPIERIWRFAVNNENLKKNLEDQLKNENLDIEVSIDNYCFF